MMYIPHSRQIITATIIVVMVMSLSFGVSWINTGIETSTAAEWRGGIVAEQHDDIENIDNDQRAHSGPGDSVVFDRWETDQTIRRLGIRNESVSEHRQGSSNIPPTSQQERGDLTIDVRHSNGGQADEVNALVIYQDDQSEVYEKVEIYPGVDLEQTFSNLPAGHDYLVEAYIHDQFAGATGLISIESGESKSRTIDADDPIYVEPVVYYADGATPLPGATVTVESHAGYQWRDAMTRSDGRTDPNQLWLYPPNKGKYIISVEYDGQTVAEKELDASNFNSPRSVKLVSTVSIPEYDLSVTAESGGTVQINPPGISTEGTTETYEQGTEVELTASASSGSRFDGWEGDVTSDSRSLTVTMDEAKDVTATFSEETGDLSIDVRHSNGEQAEEVNGLVIYQDNSENEYDRIQNYDGVNLEQTFSDLPAGHDYLVEAYVQDQFAGATRWVSIDGDVSKSRTIDIDDPVYVEPVVYYADGSTPLPGATVTIESHEGHQWRGATTGSDGLTDPEQLWLYPPNEGSYTVSVEYDGEVVAEKVLDEGNFDGSQSIEIETDISVPVSDGTIVEYLNPDQGETYELDEWYDVRLRIENPGDTSQTYEVRADTPSGTEVEEETKRVQISPGETETVSFRQRFYGVNTPTRTFSHDLYAVAPTTDELEKVDQSNVTLVGPDVGTLQLEFVDEHGDSVNADFELRDADGDTVRDGRSDKVFRNIETGEYTITADADGHYSTFESFDLDEESDRTVTVTLPSEDYDVAIDDVTLADDATVYGDGDTVTVEANIQNTGSNEHTFFIGFSTIGPEGEYYDNNGTTGTAVTLAPGESKSVTLEWAVEENAPNGEYGFEVGVWWESDRDELGTKLESAVRESKFEVGSTDAGELPIAVGRDDPEAGSTVALAIENPNPKVEYEWKVTAPSDDAADLLHESGEHTTLTTREAGEYEVEVVATAPDGSTTTNAINVTATKTTVDQLDADVMDLAEQYAPVLQFHEDEMFYPTRYEAYVENSAIEMGSGENISNPSMLDLDPDRRGHTSEAYLDPGTTNNEELQEFQNWNKYPETVYTSVHEVTYEGEDYVAIGYWMVYVHDPKPERTRGVYDFLAAHTGDQEPVFVLINESGPQWVAAQQHFGGEIRRWDRVNTTNDHPVLYVGEGAHSNFFGPYAGQTDQSLHSAVDSDEDLDYLYQEQYLCREKVQVTCPLPDVNDDSTNPAARAAEYTDPIEIQGPTWVHDNAISGDKQYELVHLSGNESWAAYDGDVYKYENPGKKPRGNLPPQQERWSDGLSEYIDNRVFPDRDQIDAEIVGSDGRKIVRQPGEPLGEVIGIQNIGLQPDNFVITITAMERNSGRSETVEYTNFVNTGNVERRAFVSLDRRGSTIIPNYEDVSIPLQLDRGTWDVEVKLSLYAEDIRDEDRDVLDTSNFDVEVEDRDVDATVSFTDEPSGDYQPGDDVKATAEVENMGNNEHTFFVGFSARGPDEQYYDNDKTTGTKVTLEPGESTRVDLSWTVEENIPMGSYDITTAVWEESNSDDLQTQIDSARSEETVIIPSKPNVENVEVKNITDDSIILNATATNNGATADWQSLAISFPGMENAADVAVRKTSFQDGATVLKPGRTVGAEYGTNETELEYPLVEAASTDWATGESKYVELELPRDQLGQEAYVKSVAFADDDRIWVAAPGREETSTVDQQSEYVRTIQLNAPDDVTDGDTGGSQSDDADRTETDTTDSVDNRTDIEENQSLDSDTTDTTGDVSNPVDDGETADSDGETNSRMDDDSNDESETDRSVSKEVRIVSTGSDRAFYEFTVSGELELGENANPVNAEYPDEVDGQTGAGSVAGGSDNFQFTGNIENITVDGPVEVYVDGEQIDVQEGDLGPGSDDTSSDDGSEALSNEIRIVSTSGDRAFYEFTVSGELELGENANPVNAEYPDEIDGRTGSGSVAGGADNFQFSGNIEDITVNGPVEVYVNGQRIDVQQGDVGPKTDDFYVSSQRLSFDTEAPAKIDGNGDHFVSGVFISTASAPPHRVDTVTRKAGGAL